MDELEEYIGIFDEDDAIDIAILDEIQKEKKPGDGKNNGCCLVFLVLGASLGLSVWCTSQIL